MKGVVLALFSALLLSANELILISNDASEKNLETLHQKYGQALLINKELVYLIPKTCRLERYFAGASEGELKLADLPAHTHSIAPTQEVFEAKDAKSIKKKIGTEKAIALVGGEIPKAFLQESEGHAFGGASEVPLNFTFQKNEAIKTNLYVAKMEPTEAKESKPDRHPTCRLLEDGSAYRLEHIQNAKFYSAKILEPVENPVIKFK